MKNIGLIYLSLAFIALITITGCREDSSADVVESIQSAEDNSIAENEFSAIFDYVNDQGDNNIFNGYNQQKKPETQGLFDLIPACATVTVDSVNRLIIINFGTSNCLCKDGRTRRGTIIALFNGKYKDNGSSVTVTLESFYVNDMPVTGMKTITRISADKWNTEVVNASITRPEGKISWQSNRTIERTAGGNTRSVLDDTYEVTGNGSGTNVNGVQFTFTIDQALIRIIDLTCPFKNFRSGIWTLVNDKGATMSLDYDPIGGAPCDNIADVTINGKTKRIVIK